MDDDKYAAGMSKVTASAREDGKRTALAGLPRVAVGVPRHFRAAWRRGYDEARSTETTVH